MESAERNAIIDEFGALRTGHRKLTTVARLSSAAELPKAA
jgi:hypothetical protein